MLRWRHIPFAAPNLLAAQVLLNWGRRIEPVGEYIRAFAKHPHLVKTQYSAFLKRLPEEDLIRRSLSLG